MKRWLWSIPVVGLVVAGWASYRIYEARTHQVKVVSLGKGVDDSVSPSPAERPQGAHVPQVRPSLGEAVAKPALTQPAAFYEPSAVTKSVTSGTVISKLQREAKLEEPEQKRLTAMFQLASNIQLGIDAEPTEATRVTLQRNLIGQVETRLRLILKDQARVDLAIAELSGLPRIDG